jgi:aspartyl/asparaginyl beta-hydroxylase (cupin superfamily)
MISSKNEIIVEEPIPIKHRQEYYSVNEFPKLIIFEENYQLILSELQTVLKHEEKNKLFSPWVEKNLYESSDPEGWQVIPLIMNGTKIEKYCSHFQRLIEIVNSVSGIVTVVISKLKYDSWIAPHNGYENYADKILRYHLGLIIPEGDLGFRVNSSIKYWENGKSFIFDDSLIHSAWNFTKEDRYILIIDFIRNENENIESLSNLILTEEARYFYDFYNDQINSYK